MKRLIDRAGWALAGALGLALVLVGARVIQAGPLDPPGPVASTLQTLGDLPPSWNQILLANDGADTCHSTRFTCIMGNAAVLDHETGLVWQQAPSASTVTWVVAIATCEGASTGGRRGWRVPGPEELNSLSTPRLGLPTGHPFVATAGAYWSSALFSVDPALSITIDPTALSNPFGWRSRSDSATTRVWCVRGDATQGADAQSPFPQLWRQTLLSASDGTNNTHSSRFNDMTNIGVVTDHETGLAWQLTPDSLTSNWSTAVSTCARLGPAGVSLGWRLPTLAELLSLFTFTALDALPAGHPFQGIIGVYWTSSTDAASTANAYTVDISQVGTSTTLAKTTTTPKHWCVRGGPGQ